MGTAPPRRRCGGQRRLRRVAGQREAGSGEHAFHRASGEQQWLAGFASRDGKDQAGVVAELIGTAVHRSPVGDNPDVAGAVDCQVFRVGEAHAFLPGRATGGHAKALDESLQLRPRQQAEVLNSVWIARPHRGGSALDPAEPQAQHPEPGALMLALAFLSAAALA